MTLPKLESHPYDLPAEEFGSMTDLLAELGQSNEPIATVLTCWELGGTPDQVPHANPGEIMVVQNPGGLVAAADADEKVDSPSSILYCLQKPTMQHLIVCGHTQCVTLATMLGDSTKGTLDVFRQTLESVSRRFHEFYAKRPEREWLRIIAQESVLQQLASLRGQAKIRSRLHDGSLCLHGWMRDDETSVVAPFDPASGQFSA
jgi:carbonic anhydrase